MTRHLRADVHLGQRQFSEQDRFLQQCLNAQEVALSPKSTVKSPPDPLPDSHPRCPTPHSLSSSPAYKRHQHNILPTLDAQGFFRGSLLQHRKPVTKSSIFQISPLWPHYLLNPLPQPRSKPLII